MSWNDVASIINRMFCSQVASSINIRSWYNVAPSINNIPWFGVVFIIESKSWPQVAPISNRRSWYEVAPIIDSSSWSQIALLTNSKPFLWLVFMPRLSKIAGRGLRVRPSLISSHDLTLLSAMPSKGGGHHCQRYWSSVPP